MNVIFFGIGFAVAAILILLGILILAATKASRSKPRDAQTPTQSTENPYRKFYK